MKCHTLVTIECKQHFLPPEPMMTMDRSPMSLDPAQIVILYNPKSHKGLEELDEGNEAGNNWEKCMKALSSFDLHL